jgi:serine/threonine protein kinase
MAPEILNENKKLSYTKNVDVWSLGILLYFLCCKDYPFSGNDFESIY